ncbi:hypothetical protein F5B18DRAFT_674045 [Nemania serpens]|nr:hypothetical protein F5B18DRAFT_674045 [Nemania serpens]
MTCHDVPSRQIADQSHVDTYQTRYFWRDLPHNLSLSRGPVWEPTEQGWACASSRDGDARIEPDDLVAVLVREQPSYVTVLELLGFTAKTSALILRYWIALKLDAPTGGPYELLGVALATIAELGEPEMRASRGDGMGGGKMNRCPTSEWQLAFAQVLNRDGLREVCRVGAYLAPDFTKAKWLVYQMVMRRWGELIGRTTIV